MNDKNVTWNYETIKLLFDSLDIGIHVIDNNGITVLYNEACRIIDGTKEIKIIEKNLRDLVKEGIFSRAIGIEALEKGEEISTSQRVKGRLIFASSIPIYDTNDEIKFVLTECMDISKIDRTQKELDAIKKEYDYLLKELAIQSTQTENEDEIVLKSKEMQEIKNKARRIANVDSTILILGETGVGKGVISKYIHQNSPRKEGPFIKINCGSLPENLIETELFGYEEGAFTDARKGGKKGLIEISNNGTLFLDEIGELPLKLQVKLLNVLQEKTIQRVGSTQEIKVNTRIIAATNQDLKELADEGKFREDLYYRLNVVPIEIPPLRKRRDDIIPLTRIFLNKVNEEYNLSQEISSSGMKVLLSYDWPGNVRELENIIERAAVSSDDMMIDGKDIQEALYGKGPLSCLVKKKSFKKDVALFEKVLLNDYMKESKDIKDMSELTGLDTSTIRKKAKKLGIELEF